MKDYVLDPAVAELFKMVIIDSYQNSTQSERANKKQYIDQITALTNKTTRARELLLNGDIDAADYKEIKSESESKITILESRISELRDGVMPLNDFSDVVEKAVYKLSNLDVSTVNQVIKKSGELLVRCTPKTLLWKI